MYSTVLRYIESIETQFVGLAGAASVASVAAVYVYEQAISVRSINMLEKRLHRCLQLSTLWTADENGRIAVCVAQTDKKLSPNICT